MKEFFEQSERREQDLIHRIRSLQLDQSQLVDALKKCVHSLRVATVTAETMGKAERYAESIKEAEAVLKKVEAL